MSSSIFGAEQRISEPLSALAVLTGRHREKNTRATLFVWRGARACICNRPVIVSQLHCRPKVNDIAQVVYICRLPKNMLEVLEYEGIHTKQASKRTFIRTFVVFNIIEVTQLLHT